MRDYQASSGWQSRLPPPGSVWMLRDCDGGGIKITPRTRPVRELDQDVAWAGPSGDVSPRGRTIRQAMDPVPANPAVSHPKGSPLRISPGQAAAVVTQCRGSEWHGKKAGIGQKVGGTVLSDGASLSRWRAGRWKFPPSLPPQGTQGIVFSQRRPCQHPGLDSEKAAPPAVPSKAGSCPVPGLYHVQWHRPKSLLEPFRDGMVRSDPTVSRLDLPPKKHEES